MLEHIIQKKIFNILSVFKEVEREAARLAASLEVRAADGQSLAGSLRLKEAELQHIRDNLKACAWTRLNWTKILINNNAMGIEWS
jgi:hypothetical protein